MKVLVLNAGSSSLKFALADTDAGVHLQRGQLERVGTPGAVLDWNGSSVPVDAMDHVQGLSALLEIVRPGQVGAIGHRVVHGGDLTESVRITKSVLRRLETFVPMAPLHNPANIAGIRAAMKLFPGLPQIGVFDTAFHQTMPAEAYLYAVPYELFTQYRYRRYGFHGTSHRFVSQEAARLLGRPLEELKLVTLHLGNGASAAAVDRGKSVDTSMGFTPLEGLMMGSRSGDIDPGLVLELVRRFGINKVDHILNHESGIKAFFHSIDLRDVHKAAEQGDERANLALRTYAYRIKKQVGAFAAAMNGLDAVVFTAGVGEHDAELRRMVIQGLSFMGLELDAEANIRHQPLISTESSTTAALVVPTDEELAIALETIHLITS